MDSTSHRFCTSLLALVFLVFTSSLVSGEPGEQCLRECQEGESPKLCEFNFTVEWYRVLSKACFDCPSNQTDCFRPHCVAADGVTRPIITVNRQLPGPPIQVCEGDRVLVWLRNLLEDGSATSIHWHGMHMQGTPYMDGVGDLTQCNLQTGELFRYEFEARPAGTHMYHAHTGLQMGDGLHGAIVVRRPLVREPSRDLYQHDLPEHTLLITDWLPVSSVWRYMDLMHDAYDVTLPYNALINGRGRSNPLSGGGAQTPRTVLPVQQGGSYRLRVVGVNHNCPFQVSVDSHQLTLIAVDGHPVQPRVLDAFILLTGERYDFVLTANQSLGNYWVTVVGLGDCRSFMRPQAAILRYQGAPEVEPIQNPSSGRDGILLNPVPVDYEDTLVFTNHTVINADDLRFDPGSSQPQNYTAETVDYRLYMSMDFYNNDNSRYNRKELYPAPALPSRKAHFTPVLDGITFQLPSAPPLSQPEDSASLQFCNHSSLPDPRLCRQDLCLCTHLLQFPLNKVVELVLVNEGVVFAEMGHPMHLHGHSYRVLGMGKLNASLALDDVKRLDQQGALRRNFVNAPWRDTVNVLDGGYLILRFYTNNPGYWMFHCHTDSHLAQGMALVIRAGGAGDLPPVPTGTPRCGGYGSAHAYRPPTSPAQPCPTNPAYRPQEWSPLLLLAVLAAFRQLASLGE